jgi:hypothetical protein
MAYGNSIIKYSNSEFLINANVRLRPRPGRENSPHPTSPLPKGEGRRKGERFNSNKLFFSETLPLSFLKFFGGGE